MFNRLMGSFSIFSAFILMTLTGCVGTSGSGVTSVSASAGTAPSQTAPVPPISVVPAPSPPVKTPRTYSTAALVFNGGGAWAAEVTSLEGVLSSHGATYQEVNSAQLDAMSVDDLAKFGMIVFPGGAGGTEAASLTADTHARIREAVQSRGVSYIGFCAGAFIAVAPAPAAGQDVSYGLGVYAGPELGYYILESQGVTAAMTLESFADGTTRDLLWYGGPITPNVAGGVVAKYPTGDPAITEVWSGTGFVMICGVHPAAPQSTRDAFGLTDTDGMDLDLAWKLLSATLNQQPLPAF